MGQPARVLYLCAGLQSSGSTLISWCFLQRRDMDGLLDQRSDVLATLSPGLGKPLAWCKFTINTFRLSEAKTHFEDEGWDVRPLLVLRDVRSVFRSMMGKSYCRNALTAEEPPLRMRLRRFHDDWELFRARGWPMIRYESVVGDPEPTLRQACQDLQLPWDQGMLSWPKRARDIAVSAHGNASFHDTRGASLGETLHPEMALIKTDRIPPADLAWIEQQFCQYNQAHDYPAHLPPGSKCEDPSQRAVPRFENSRRYARRVRHNLPLRVARAISGWTASLLGRNGA